MPYAELHCHTNFSFLDGASHPEYLAEEAARLGLEALAVTDHDGFYGVVRFSEAARAVGLRTVFGAEMTLDLDRPQPGAADPPGAHLLVLARDPEGYALLGETITHSQMAGREKGRPTLTLSDLDRLGAGRGHWQILTGCRKGTVPAALESAGPRAAGRELGRLVDLFGPERVTVELWDHGHPVDGPRNDALARLAIEAGVDLVATNNVHYARPDDRRLACALAAVRSRRPLDDIDGWLPAASTACLRSGSEQARRFARWPGVVERAAELGRDCAFDLGLVAPNLPDFDVPSGHTEMSWLRELTERGGYTRYGPRDNELVPGAWAQIDHELAVIEQLGFPGYFLVVWEIVEFCRQSDIYCQGRGSAANSAVCYALGITNADAVRLGLLFERFLSPERDGPPDIDIDIESQRREEVIQHVYERHGRRRAAQVANVITYRAKSAVRDMGKALGHTQGTVDAWSKKITRWGSLTESTRGEMSGDTGAPAEVLMWAQRVQHFPRHLGIHSGGMVICDRPVAQVCPTEWARMEDRSVLQWDKDDCAAVGLVKFDLLGLGMLTVLHNCIDLIRGSDGTVIDLATIPQDDAVYDMLCAADSIGVFQVESRAQMATLPRLKPRHFYDLVVEVALIRPGPIQGGSVHPYLRRRNGTEAVSYLHPLLEKSLTKTLGVPLFQEQLMQMAIDVANFTPAEADQLRQAMGSKRSPERMERLRDRLYAGMAANGITGAVADEIFDKLAAFSNFGFPESHSVSFAYLVYASAWLKLHYPAAFCAALVNGQPMGFWSTQTLCADARRHGVEVRGVDLARSDADCLLERSSTSAGGWAVRLGLAEVRSVSDELAEAVEAERRQHGPFESMDDLAYRVDGVNLPQLEAMATAGAFDCFGLSRREALWAAGAVAQHRQGQLPGLVVGEKAPSLPAQSAAEEVAADLWSTGIAGTSPMSFLREHLDALGIVTAAGLWSDDLRHGQRVRVAGIVTHKQRPATASGITFMNLEDETGLVNVVISPGCWSAHRHVALSAAAVVVSGRLERVEGTININAYRLEELDLSAAANPKVASRDFR